MEDELVHEARLKQHSTVSEAIEIGRRMHAKHTILTHFSQRYAKLPLFSAGQLEPNVAFSFDSMRVRLCDLPKMPLMYPALTAMFQEDVEEMEVRTQRVKMQREVEMALIEEKAKLIAQDGS
jgi:ribonuclease Z